MPPRPLWDSYFKLPIQHRLDRHLPGFESEEKSRGEDRTRSRLMHGVLNHTINPSPNAGTLNCDPVGALAERLFLAQAAGVHCASLASSFAMRSLRLSRIGSMLQMFDSYEDAELISFTILNAGWVLTPEELAVTSAATIREKLRRHLVRAGVSDIAGPLVAFLHGEFEPNAGVYALHFHGVTLKPKKRALLSMSGRWGYSPTASGANPIVCPDINDRMKQFSYCLKSYWPQRAINIDGGRTERDRDSRRIDEPYASFVLTWLDQFSPTDITLLLGCAVGRCGQLVESRMYTSTQKIGK